MSGGRTARPPLVSQGGKIAEAFGDGSFQFGLVILDGKQIIAFPLRDRAADFALAEDGISRDDAPLQRQAFEQRERGCDLILVGLDHQVADDNRQPRGERRDHVQRLGIEPAAALQRLTVDGDVARLTLAARERAERLDRTSPSSDLKT